MLRPIREVLDLEDDARVLMIIHVPRIQRSSAVLSMCWNLDHRYGAKVLRIDRREVK